MSRTPTIIQHVDLVTLYYAIHSSVVNASQAWIRLAPKHCHKNQTATIGKMDTAIAVYQ